MTNWHRVDLIHRAMLRELEPYIERKSRLYAMLIPIITVTKAGVTVRYELTAEQQQYVDAIDEAIKQILDKAHKSIKSC